MALMSVMDLLRCSSIRPLSSQVGKLSSCARSAARMAAAACARDTRRVSRSCLERCLGGECMLPGRRVLTR